MKERLRLAAGLVVSALVCLSASAEASTSDDRHLTFRATEQATYDENLFRLPVNFPGLEQLLGPGARRSDYINSVSVGVDGKWDLAGQIVELNLTLADNEFKYNDDLDNTSRKGSLIWHWTLGGQWSGEIGADTSRSIASFANNRIFAKDLLDSNALYANGIYRVGPRWKINFGARQSESEHSLVPRKIDDTRNSAENVGVEFGFGAENLLGWDYRHSEARYPRQLAVNSGQFNGRYEENTSGLRLRYELTGKTLFEGSAGYLKHTYTAAAASADTPDFSGNVWHAMLLWQASAKTQLVLRGSRELKSYIDADSDYFISTGGSLAASWSPTQTTSLSLQYSRSKEDYIGAGAFSFGLLGRKDTVAAAQAVAEYDPIRALGITLTYRYEQRDSNRLNLSFDDNLVVLGIRLML